MNLTELVSFLDSLLLTGNFPLDSSLNGLQVDAGTTEVSKVALSVDSGQSIIDAAVATHADLLIVHHGLFWGEPLKVTGPIAAKLSVLFGSKLSLYASHLPLDGNSEVGNGYELARFLGLIELKPFLLYKGQTIGCMAQCTQVSSLSYFEQKLKECVGVKDTLALPFGRKEVRSVGIVTGSGSMAIAEAARLGLDLLVTGEPKQNAYHDAKEAKLNVIFGGHYATETFGVRALGRVISERFKIPTQFIDEPTGI